MILIQLFIPNCSLAVPPLPRHNSKLFSNSFQQLPTTAFSNIHNNQDIFQQAKCYNQKVSKTLQKGGNPKFLLFMGQAENGDDAGRGLTVMGSSVATLQLTIDSNAAPEPE